MNGDICMPFAQWIAFRQEIFQNVEIIGAGCFILGFVVSEVLTWLAYRYGTPVE